MLERKDDGRRCAGRVTDGAVRGETTRRAVLASGAGAGALMLAACASDDRMEPPVTQQTAPPPPPAVKITPTDVIGTGPVKLALLASRSGQGLAAVAGIGTINAAKMAINDFPNAQVTISVYDSQGTNPGAEAAATQAIADGAQLILGPFFADEVRGAAPQARAANIPMIAFSSDPSVAQPGVFILGFLVQDEVRQLVAVAKAANKRSVIAVLQGSAYGTLADGALRQYSSQAGLRLLPSVQVTTDQASIASAALSIAAIKDQFDCIFIPDVAGIAAPLLAQLTVNNVDLSKVQVLGSGQWNDPSVYGNPALAGAWFPAPDIAAYGIWANRYHGMFQLDPFPKTTLVYDAVFLAAALARNPSQAPFDPLVLTNAQGAISPVNGLFRLNLDGTNNRGLAIYQIVKNGPPRVLAPAPRTFVGI